MNDNLPWLSLSNEIEVKGELRNSIVDSGFKNNKGTDESYPSAYFLFCASMPKIAKETLHQGRIGMVPLEPYHWNCL